MPQNQLYGLPQSRKFWKAIKYLNKQQSTIPTLQQGEQTASTDQQKAALLNSYFSACFNRSHPPPAAFDPPPSPQHDSSLVQMHCTIPEVEHLLQGLDVTKASGPDKVSAQMLKCTASCIAPSVTKLFNLSIRVGRIPDSWKESMIAPIPKSSTKYLILGITDQFPSPVFSVNYWRSTYTVSCMNICPTSKC